MKFQILLQRGIFCVHVFLLSEPEKMVLVSDPEHYLILA